jgi:hypothetical protein
MKNQAGKTRRSRKHRAQTPPADIATEIRLPLDGGAAFAPGIVL